jgi:hypothetical protein
MPFRVFHTPPARSAFSTLGYAALLGFILAAFVLHLARTGKALAGNKSLEKPAYASTQ